MPFHSSASHLGFAAFILIAGLGHTQAGDAAARRVLGFSPDGRYFAIEQYSMIYDAEESFAEYIFIETNTDQFVRGTPIKVTTRGADGLDETKARTVAAANAMPLLKRLRIGVSGVKIAGRPSIDLDNIGIYQSRIEPLAKSLDIHLFADRPAKLTVVSITIVESMCEGVGGRPRGLRSPG